MQAVSAGHARAWTRGFAPLMAGLAVVGIVAGVSIAATARGGSKLPSGATRPSAGVAAPALVAGAKPTIGQQYSFSLLIHCGVQTVGFGGRAWDPVQPVPIYPGARPEGDIVTETGYVAGTMTLVNADTLRFVADPRTVMSPFTVVFKPVTVASENQVCA
jgi:hypothetical protein